MRSPVAAAAAAATSTAAGVVAAGEAVTALVALAGVVPGGDWNNFKIW